MKIAEEKSAAHQELRDASIKDFGEQWTHYTDNSGFYGSAELFEDICGGLMTRGDLEGREILEIGSGTGRIVLMLLACGAKRVLAVEPSDAFHALQKNLSNHAEQVVLYHTRGDEINFQDCVDVSCSIGVLHHIPDPRPVVEAMKRALRPGGKILVWLYGWEGNELYLAVFSPLRKITMALPHFALAFLCHFINIALLPYIALCKFLPLPCADYVKNIFAKFSWDKRYLVIYDQLNPAYAKYYRKQEAIELLQSAGFSNIRIFNRHGYSWTVIGDKI